MNERSGNTIRDSPANRQASRTFAVAVTLAAKRQGDRRDDAGIPGEVKDGRALAGHLQRPRLMPV